MRKHNPLGYRFFLILVLLGLILVTPVSYAISGVPTIMSYQGRLTDASGNLLGGSSGLTYYFKFSIWDSPTVDYGNRLWPISAPTATSTIVKSGVFNVNIGDTANGYPDPLTYNFNTNQAIYLQVQVSSNNSSWETLSPRQRIASAPFAQLAGAVSGTSTPSSFGTTTPIGNSVVTIEASSTIAIPLFIRAALNQLANLFQIQDSTGSDLFVVDNSGKVGIATTSPLGTLSVEMGTLNPSFVVSNEGSSTPAFWIGGVNQDGRVGIGTMTPGRRLDISEGSSFPQLRLGLLSSPYGEFYVDSYGDVQLSSNSGNGGNFRMKDENLWVCTEGGCDKEAAPPTDEGNIIVETSVFFDNNFRLDASTTVVTMYATTGQPILEFDGGQ